MTALYVNYPKWISPFVIPGSTLIRWYSLMYLCAFATGYILLHYMVCHRQTRCVIEAHETLDQDLVFVAAISMVVGARLGSCLIYSGSFYWTHPWLIFWPFQGGEFVGLPGMSYHGGLFTAIAVLIIWAKKHSLSPLGVLDDIATVSPFGYTFGRLGNFFNAELYGRVTTSRLGMVFPTAPMFSTQYSWVRSVAEKVGMDANSPFLNLPRHPSQLYEAFFEGIVIGVIMWFLVRKFLKKLPNGTPTGIYLILYGLTRFFIEYFRQPDDDIGYVISPKGATNWYLFESFSNISMGQILCILMMLCGALFIYLSFKLQSKRALDK